MVSDVIIWKPTYDKSKRGRPRRTYVDQLVDDKLCDVNEIKKRWKIEMVEGRLSENAEQARHGKVRYIYKYIKFKWY